MELVAINHAGSTSPEPSMINNSKLSNFDAFTYFYYSKSLKSGLKVGIKKYSPLVLNLALSVITFFLAAYIQSFAMILSDSFYTNGEPSLKDRIHGFLDYKPVEFARDYVNLFILFLTITTIVRFVIFTPLKFVLLIFTRFFWTLAFLQLVRGLALIVTTVPCPTNCHPLRANSVLDVFRTGLQVLTLERNACTDLIVSGHSLFITNLTLVWVYYSARNLIILFLIVSYAIFLYTLIAISFFHYTIDILMAICFGSMVWFLYHHFLDIACFDFKYKNSLASYKGYETMVKTKYRFAYQMSKFVALLDGMSYYMKLQIMEECYFLNSNRFPNSFIPRMPSFPIGNLFSPFKKAPLLSADDLLFNSLCENHIILEKDFQHIYSTDGRINFYFSTKP